MAQDTLFGAPLPRHFVVFIIIFGFSQYACAKNKLCESSSTSSTSTSSEEDRRSIEPFLQIEEPVGRASDPRECALYLMGKEEDRGSLEVCTGSKLKPEPGPYPRSSDPTRPDPSGTVKFRARTRPEIPPPRPTTNN